MNTINMSEYQKLIFVNNINEDDSSKIQQLSKDYPFAVFFTVKNKDIHNIWNDGVRLTRFVGIDSNNDIIKVGSHTLKLKFNYDTGLLGIIDTNKLKAIKVNSIHYTALDGTNHDEDIYTLNQNVLINAKDNKFKLVVQFQYDETTGELDKDNNVTKISPSLNFKVDNNNYIYSHNNYFSVIGNPICKRVWSTTGNNNQPTLAEYEYNCIINYESHDEPDNGIISYNIVSQYDETQYWPLGIKFYLNPISYTLYNGNNTILNNSTIVLENNQTYNFRIEIKPSNDDIYSYPRYYEGDRPLNLIVNTENTNIANINGNVQSLAIPIDSNTVNFNIKTFEPANNSIGESTITLRIQNGNYISATGDVLTQKFKIKLNGATNNCYYYAGFVDPTSTTFDGLIDFSNINSSGNVLWDWEQHRSEANSNNDNYFYIVIPYAYRNSILPCWDAYIMQGNTKLYIEAKNRFEVVRYHKDLPDESDEWPADYNGSGIGNKNISMIIYKSTNIFNNAADAKGLFYGKIQIQ